MSQEQHELLNPPVIQPISEMMQSNFLDYSMSVITDRALPDARDGLKPVHRRILHAMNSLGIGHGSPYKKSARVVGEVIGKYHPHGDSAAYLAAVRMAQPWSMRHPLIDGQGNFGSIDGDSPAAMRYTEMRMARMASSMFQDIHVVDYRDNFDGTETEPEVLPCAFPNLLVNGGVGVAVGMATSIPPHNLKEVSAAFLAWMDDPDISTSDLVELMPAPDFPTGGIVHGLSGYRAALETGRGRVRLRARWELEEGQREQKRVVITEIPYLANKSTLVEAIAGLVKDKAKHEGIGIADIRDESSKKGIRVVLDLKRGEDPEVLMNRLMAVTDLDVSVAYNIRALRNGQPEQMTLRDIFETFRDHRIEVIQRRTRFDLDKALKRLHILDGLLKALDRLDEVIATIRGSADSEEARGRLSALLDIDADQANAILEMKLQRLTGLQIRDLRAEHDKLTAHVNDLRDLLASETRQRQVLSDELMAVCRAHGTDRKTEIGHGLSEVTDADLIPVEDVLVISTQAGYLKRIPVSALKQQGRGTRGRSLIDVGDDDIVTSIFFTSSHAPLLAVTDQGQVHAVKAYDIPESGFGSRGRHFSNVFAGLEGHVVAMVSPAADEDSDENTLVMVTAQGLVKRTKVSEYRAAGRAGGIKGINLIDGDQIVSVRSSTSDDDSLILVGSNSKSVRFRIGEARFVGRVSQGVRGMKLPAEERVITAEVVPVDAEQDCSLVSVGVHGIGKATKMSEFPINHRGVSGVRCFKAIKRSGDLAAATLLRNGEDLVLFSDQGGANRVSGDNVPRNSRASAGACIINNGKIIGCIAVPGSEPELPPDNVPVH